MEYNETDNECKSNKSCDIYKCTVNSSEFDTHEYFCQVLQGDSFTDLTTYLFQKQRKFQAYNQKIGQKWKFSQISYYSHHNTVSLQNSQNFKKICSEWRV